MKDSVKQIRDHNVWDYKYKDIGYLRMFYLFKTGRITEGVESLIIK